MVDEDVLLNVHLAFWKINGEFFHRALNVKLDFAIDIVMPCCVLQNYIRGRGGLQFQDPLYRFPTFDAVDGPSRHWRNYASKVGILFAEYFVNEGAALGKMIMCSSSFFHMKCCTEKFLTY